MNVEKNENNLKFGDEINANTQRDNIQIDNDTNKTIIRLKNIERDKYGNNKSKRSCTIRK